MLRKKIIICVSFVVLLFAIVFSTLLSGCSKSKHTDPGASVSTEEALTENGVRKDIEEYIQNTYPDSAKKRAALNSYAQKLQEAYTEVTNVEDAINMETKIINALTCVEKFGDDLGNNSPSATVGAMTSNTPERLEAQLKYEKFLDGKAFTMPSLDSEQVCDFDPNLLPN